MYIEKILSFYSLLLIWTAQHSVTAKCTVFDQIDEAKYDMTYHTISEVDARPLGFIKATQYFSPNSGDSTPCFSVESLEPEQQVEVKYQTVPASLLCMRDNNGKDYGCAETFEVCKGYQNANTEFEFYCEVGLGCSESNVNFWVRITKGPKPADDTEGMWCHWRDNKFPETLATIPDFVDPQPDIPKTQSGSALSTSFTLMVTLTFVVSLLCSKLL